MKNEINRIAGRLVKAYNTNTVINPIPVKYCKNINLANKLRKLCEDQIKDETIGIKAGGTGIQSLKKLKEKEPFTAKVFKKRLVEFRKEISKFQQDKQKVVNEFNQKKKIEFGEFFKKITPIIEQYVSEKKIDIVLDKKNIFLASKKKDITQEIINIIDSKIK